MPKIQKLRKYRTAKQSSDQQYIGSTGKSDVTNENNNVVNEVLSKGQRKRRQKRASLMVKMGMAEPKLKYNKASTKKEKRDAFNALLSELESSLPGENDVVRPAAAVSVRTNKLKKTLAVRETQRMKLVQQHPAFVENPLEAVKKHIEHMLATKKGSNTN